jgi:hypothetical protein
MEIFKGIAFSTALLYPLFLLFVSVILCASVILFFAYRWNKIIFGIALSAFLVSISLLGLNAQTQFQDKGFFCVGENLCFEAKARSVDDCEKWFKDAAGSRQLCILNLN